jgi:hypothetical protein
MSQAAQETDAVMPSHCCLPCYHWRLQQYPAEQWVSLPRMHELLWKRTITWRSVHCAAQIQIGMLTVVSVQQYAESFRAGLLANKVNGLAVMQGDMAPGRVIISIEKRRSAAETALYILRCVHQQQRPSALSDRTCVQPCRNPSPKIEAHRVCGMVRSNCGLACTRIVP